MTVLSFVSTGGTRVYDHDFYLMRRRLDTLPSDDDWSASSLLLLLRMVFQFSCFLSRHTTSFRNPKFGGDPSASRASLRSIPITMAQRSDTVVLTLKVIWMMLVV